MRIIAGQLKGNTLYMPKDKSTRPLKDIVRESIFNLIAHSKSISLEFNQINVLDLYAGTGSFGLECLSRQAKTVCFVEKNKNTIEVLKKNIEKLKIKKKITIFVDDALSLIEKQKIDSLKFDVIFCDPPFKDANIKKLINLIFRKKLLNKNGIMILHRNKNTDEILPDFFKIIDERIYGLSKILFGKFST
jgi:16S rRNA (guanine966-N2)-methyltransferase|tara:strand:+ start:56 stop:625 length:570 start_codon:yes stop_codon:yes gene_type:complete